MAVISVEKRDDNGDAYHDRTDYVDIYDVVCDSLSDTPHTVGSSNSLPHVGATYPGNPWAYLLHVHVERNAECPIAWVVTCRYSTQLPPAIAQTLSTPAGVENPVSQAFEPNPLNRPARVVGKTTKRQIAVTRDPILNQVIKNSAGEPIDPATTRNKSRAAIEVTKNLPSFNLASMVAEFCDKINSASYQGFAPRTLYLDDLHAELSFENNQRFTSVTALFVIEPETWLYQFLDAGYNELVNGVLVPLENRGRSPSRPVMLDGAGRRLAQGGTPVYRGNYTIPEVDFAGLGLF